MKKGQETDHGVKPKDSGDCTVKLYVGSSSKSSTCRQGHTVDAPSARGSLWSGPKNARERDGRNTGHFVCQHSPTRKRNGLGEALHRKQQRKWARPANTRTSCSCSRSRLRTSQWQLQPSWCPLMCRVCVTCVRPCCLPRWRTR